MGKGLDDSFLDHLQNPDSREALLGFAGKFIGFHLSGEHIATYRLLVSESVKAPEILSSFLSAGPDDTEAQLSAFFSERFNLEKAETVTRLWTGMLLSMRSGVLVGEEKPSKQMIDDYAREATDFVLAAIS